MSGRIYKLKEKYYELDEESKLLIGEIVRFCENNERFPSEKEMTIKNGYVSRTKFCKHFKIKTFIEIYDYIEPIKEEKPKYYKCNCCNKEKLFTRENFAYCKMGKFSLKPTCIKCESEKTRIRNYNKKGINIKKITDLSVYEWHNLTVEGKIHKIPPEFYNECNCVKAIRQLILKEINNVVDKNLILDVFTQDFAKKNKIKIWVSELGGKIACLNKCFEEIKFEKEDMDKYSYDDHILILERNFKKQNVSVLDILNGKFNTKKSKELDNLFSRNRNNNINANNVYLNYFADKNIKHPITNKEITIYDFANTSKGFFENEENRISAIKHYCENVCDVSILEVIDDNKRLIKWIGEYFTQTKLSKILTYLHYFSGIYECLVATYPQIKRDNILFEWEWTQSNNVNKEYLIKTMRELVMYRIPFIKDIEKDVPKYINSGYLNESYPKLVKHIRRNRFASFYEWATLAFPEYENVWTKEDFKIIESQDGHIFDSYQEKSIYEYIKYNDTFKYVKPIGRKKSGKYVFNDTASKYSSYCPDFVIEYVNVDNKKIKLDKPIIIEYYGMYEDKSKNKRFKEYKKKTLAKEVYYKNNGDIYYIGIYPKHIKNSFKGLAELLDLFCIKNNLNLLVA